MAEPNPEDWAWMHMRWLALSRWNTEGGASASRPTAGSAGVSARLAEPKGLNPPPDPVHGFLNTRLSGAPRHQGQLAESRAIEHRNP